MTTHGFDAFLAFAWRAEFDSPAQGCHVTEHDPGGATFGGVTLATWTHACTVGLAQGALADASREQLATVLRATCWYPTAALVQPGMDLLIANGRMMSGRFLFLVQQCCGLVGASVDGFIGPHSLAKIAAADTETLIDAVTGAHYAYLTTLPEWQHFGRGWTARLLAAQSQAISMVQHK